MVADSQCRVGIYRADFEVSLGVYVKMASGKDSHCNIVSCLVECDSLQFHDRTEKERSYEKKRDRFFQLSGKNVLHFTGSEIFNNANECAYEILHFLITKYGEKHG